MKVKSLHPVSSKRKVARNPLVVSIIVSLMVPAVVESRVLFEESFDDLPDYTSSEELDLEGWDHRRNGEVNWSPSNGYPDKHDAFEILESNADKARGGTGKSFVAWRESYDPGWQRWNSDGILAKKLDQGVSQLYVSFYIRFEENWTPGGQSKFFRAYYWNGEGSPFQFFDDGNSGPIFLWDYNENNYGVRNVHAYRGGPPEGSYYQMTSEDIYDTPRGVNNLGSFSLNYTQDTVGMAADGGTPKIPDQVNGGYLSDNLNQTVKHAQLFGRPENWTKVAFFLKMNSEPGANDGELIQWINDEQVYVNRTIRWVKDNPDNRMVQWNMVAIGGNDNWQAYPNSQMREEWYSIDDVYMATEIPDDVISGGSDDGAVSRPNPPSGVTADGG
ncbi:hypothetical protein ACJO2E_10135 [Marinobacter sp. M1N3S26]|uniref:hypothetical protein n=1 Tax=unclassified Marinobacter TaxID=83889 RepID=UPI00387B7F47